MGFHDFLTPEVSAQGHHSRSINSCLSIGTQRFPGFARVFLGPSGDFTKAKSAATILESTPLDSARGFLVFNNINK